MVFVNVFGFPSIVAFFFEHSPPRLLTIFYLKMRVLRNEILVSWFIQAPRTKGNGLGSI